MKYKHLAWRSTALAASALCLASAPQALAQQAPAASAIGTEPTTRALPPGAIASNGEDVVVLDPFVVSANEAVGYRATSTLAGTRIRSDLKDVGSAISVVTAEFLRDTGAKNNQDLLVYTANTEVGGIGGNFTGTGNGPALDESALLVTPQQNTRVRGLGAADSTRDFFMTDIPWDSYNVGRVDLQRGSNSVLFGLGSPAGIVNSTLNGASLKSAHSVETRIDNEGSYRLSLDFNQVLLPGELALRFNGLHDRTFWQQKPSNSTDRRYFGALRFDPSFLNKGSAKTSLRVNYEHGEIKANRPRSLPPIDKITNWFSNGKAVFDPITSWSVRPTDGWRGEHQAADGTGAPNPYYQAWLGDLGSTLGGPIAVFQDPNSGFQNISLAGLPGTNNPHFALIQGEMQRERGLGASGLPDRSIESLPFHRLGGVKNYADYARDMRLPNWEMGLYKNKYLTDSSIFDFYNKLLDGNNKREWQRWEAGNVALSQLFLNDRVGIEAVYDKQRYSDGQTSMLSGQNQAIDIDLNSHLIEAFPTVRVANPNVGRPVVTSNGSGGNWSRTTERDSKRVTAYGEFRFTDVMERSWLTSVLGTHRATLLWSTEQYDLERREWMRYATDGAYGAFIGLNDTTANSRQVSILSYLGPSLRDRPSAAGANLASLGAIQMPTSGRMSLFDANWRWTPGTGPNPADPYDLDGDGVTTFHPTTGAPESTQSENWQNYVGWTTRDVNILNADQGDIDRLYRDAYKFRRKVSSKVGVLQSFMFDGLFVPMLAYREDTVKSYSKRAGVDAVTRTYDVHAADYRVPSTPDARIKDYSVQWSMVAHTPQFLRTKLPGNAGLSLFYNRGSNFEAGRVRVDFMGDPLAPPTGQTKDYGFVITALDDKLSLKVNWYESRIKNSDAPLSTINVGRIGWTEQMVFNFAKIYQNSWGPSWQSGYIPWPNQTQAQADAVKTAAFTAYLANLPPQQFLDAWKIDTSDAAWQNRRDTSKPPINVAATSDAVSKGVEFELTTNPVRGLNLTLNVTKVEASYSNLGGKLAEWIESRNELFNGPAGDVRLWWGGSTYTGRVAWQEFYTGYTLFRLTEGTNVPEMRKWRVNIVGNYTFQGGFLKGFNVGGGYRWEDHNIIGYPVVNGSFDIDNPVPGPTADNVDFWIGYERMLTAKLKWRVQLNGNNVFSDRKLIPISIQPNGDIAGVRIPSSTRWTLTNTFSF